jgi:hypothetical protein
MDYDVEKIDPQSRAEQERRKMARDGFHVVLKHPNGRIIYISRQEGAFVRFLLRIGYERIGE